MEEILDASRMMEIDNKTINEYGIPQLELMERAARAVEGVIIKSFDEEARVLVVCGMGNNGGDGLAVSRMLTDRGYHVSVLHVGDNSKRTEASIWQKEHICCADEYDIRTGEDSLSLAVKECFSQADVIVDAVFGVGLKRDVSGIYQLVITAINEASEAGACVVAVDMPSGIDTDTGAVRGGAVRADITVTFGFRKKGQLIFPGREYCGEVVTADIGFASEKYTGVNADVFCLDSEILKELPKRKASSNKGTYGKLFIRAGSAGMAGAALLSAEAAYRTGTGLVYLATPESNRIIAQIALPEAVYISSDGQDFTAEADRYSAAVVGPGLSTKEEAHEDLKRILNTFRCPLVLDADALNLIAMHDMYEAVRSYEGRVIVTPHVAELSRLLKKSIAEVKADPEKSAREAAHMLDCVCVCKDATTLITDGEVTYINICGSNGMSTGGSGDVLAGIIGGLVSQGMESLNAAAAGVYIHARAGEAAAEESGERFMLARDIISHMKEVLR